MAHKDDHLVELELINQVHKLSDLITLLKAHVILAETMECQLAFILNQNFGWIAHKFATGELDFV